MANLPEITIPSSIGEIIHFPKGESPTDPPPRLRPHSLNDFLKLDIKPREMLLDPILPQKGLAMLYGTRGTARRRRIPRQSRQQMAYRLAPMRRRSPAILRSLYSARR
jgi:hypothetical protein